MRCWNKLWNCGRAPRSLIGSQRRADALKVFHDTRHHLVRELGVEPGDLLRGTHERILRDPVEAPAGG
ncbi:BTAD domain-containing putative transcriptional regulator [Streptomyces sp. NPDC000134]|uniref:BTAD domain-containing putative transcriptional regulator n=1 Tax=Streptomyces sp. NPDC000134 TaxID=3364536 RepID=UPI003696FEC4